MEYNRLLGAKINGPIDRRGKIASAQTLSLNANRLGLTNVDYRAQGYVTEVKDQVRFSSIFLVDHHSYAYFYSKVSFQLTKVQASVC